MSGSVDLALVKDAVLWLAPTFVLPVYCYFISQTRRNFFQHILWVIGIIACGFIPMTVPAKNTAVRFEFLILFGESISSSARRLALSSDGIDAQERLLTFFLVFRLVGGFHCSHSR